MVRRIFRRIEQRPEVGFGVINALTRYAQARQMGAAEMGAEAAAPRPQFLPVESLIASVAE